MEKVQALLMMPMPTDASMLRSLLGGLGHYRKFITRMAARIKPLTRLLREGVSFQFTSEHEAIIKEILTHLTSTDVLAFPDYEGAAQGQRPFMLTTDAPLDGLGEVVEHTGKKTIRFALLCFQVEKHFPARKLDCVRIRRSSHFVGH